MFCVLFAGKGLDQRIGHLVEELVYVVAQTRTAARRQLQGLRAIRIVEIMRVSPVGGHTAGAGFAFQKTGDDGRLAGAHRPHGKDVVALIGNFDAKFDGTRRPFLADDLVQFGRVGCRRKRKAGQLHAAAQLRGSQLRRRLNHAYSPRSIRQVVCFCMAETMSTR